MPTSQFPPNSAKLYLVAQQKTQKLWPMFLGACCCCLVTTEAHLVRVCAVADFVTRIGQSQLIRRQIANELNVRCFPHTSCWAHLCPLQFSCKLDSKILSCALDVMNHSLINDVRAHYSR